MPDASGEVLERLARIETKLAHIEDALRVPDGQTLTSLSHRVAELESEVHRISDLLSQWRGAAVLLGLVWPLVLDWIKSAVFK